MKRETRRSLRDLLFARIAFLPPQLLAVADQLEQFGSDYERAYEASSGQVLHLVLLALGVPFDEILGVSSASASRVDLLSLRAMFPPHALPLFARNGPRTSLLELAEDVVNPVVPGGLPVDTRRKLADLGTDYETAYWDDDLILMMIVPVFGADIREWLSWFQSQGASQWVPETDGALRARWPLQRVLDLSHARG